jgi:hypothetical protein
LPRKSGGRGPYGVRRTVTSFPPLLRGRVYGDFREDDGYFVTAFDLILAVYGISRQDLAVADLRESLRGQTMR